MISYGSVCSGVEAATLAWRPLGWRAAWFAEIEPFPSAVLAHRFPETVNLGDMTTLPARILAGDVEAPDVLTGGTPCQAFSVAGMRAGLADARGQLSLAFCMLANAIDSVRLARGLPPCVIVWENVPGVLSDAGNAFGCFLAGLAGSEEPLIPEPLPAAGRSSRYWRWSKKRSHHTPSWADAGAVLGVARTIGWRVLDAQFFGLPQRRRRVWVAASARAGFDPIAVLLEFEGVRRTAPPSRAAREDVAGTLAGGARRSGGWSGDDIPQVAAFGISSDCLDRSGEGAGGTAGERPGLGITSDFSPTIRAKGPSAVAVAPLLEPGHRTGRSTADPKCGLGIGVPGDPSFTLNAERPHGVVAFSCKDAGGDAGEIAPTLRSMGHATSHANAGGQVAIAMVKTHRATSPEDAEIWRLGDCVPTLTARERDYDDGQTQVVVGALTSAHGPHGHGGSGLATDKGLDAGHVFPWDAGARRLTPRECERLQGEPDDHTLIPWRGRAAADCPDGPRYKAIGNSWAVPCAAWIGARIARAFNDPATLFEGLPAMSQDLLPPPHCRILEFEGRVVLADNDGVVYLEMAPDGYDAQGRPIWEPGSQAKATQRAIMIQRVITAYHNSFWLQDETAKVPAQTIS